MKDQANWLTAQRAATVAAIRTAESPAEAALLVHLLMARDGDGYAVGGAGCSWLLVTQCNVTVEKATYRLDIALTRGAHRVCVEVDGHEWHHATEEQEARDAARDFALRATGWGVIRVDARDALERPTWCVDHIVGRLQEIDRVGVRKMPKAVEDQTDEEFAETLAVFEVAIRANPETAAENAEKVARLRMSREKAIAQRALLKRELDGTAPDAEMGDKILRALYEAARSAHKTRAA